MRTPTTHFNCDLCPVETVSDAMPQGWSFLFGRDYCPLHIIVLTIGGVVTAMEGVANAL